MKNYTSKMEKNTPVRKFMKKGGDRPDHSRRDDTSVSKSLFVPHHAQERSVL